jgi:hypothetical protein
MIVNLLPEVESVADTNINGQTGLEHEGDTFTTRAVVYVVQKGGHILHHA